MCFELGIPGVKESLLQEFGIRLVTYDLPGFGESDPHPRRNLESSALDMLHLSYALNVSGKFWTVGFSDGSIHVWSALRYIPDKVEGISVYSLQFFIPIDNFLTKMWSFNSALSLQVLSWLLLWLAPMNRD